MNHAVIDIGTNTIILLVVKVKGKKVEEVLHDEAIITRLGQALTENHFFLSPAMDRTTATLQKFAETCEKFKVKKIVAVGTAACRIAANASVFINRVKKETGIKIQVISGDQEAEFAFASVWNDFGAKHKKIIVVDIGGGSTEIITGPMPKKQGLPDNVISLHLGSVRFTEQYITRDPITQEEFARLQLAVKNAIADELDDFYPKDFDPTQYTLVATAGTATTLAAMDKKLTKYSSKKIQGTKLTLDNLEKLIDELAAKSIAERQKMPGLEPLRADVILTGALILRETMTYFKQTETLISDRGLRFGVLAKKILN